MDSSNVYEIVARLLCIGSFCMYAPLSAEPYIPFGPAVKVVSGGQHACAIESSGELYCWGFNGAGELGLGNREDRPLPQQISLGASTAAKVSLGRFHSCAINALGTTFCWGSNSKGQIGTGSGGDRLSPVSISELGTNATSISAGEEHTCAVLVDGSAKCWGANGSGQLGDDQEFPLNKNRPVDVVNLVDATAIAVGSNHSCALRQNGDVMCWGSPQVLGTNAATTNGAPSARVELPLAATQIGSGEDFSCARLTDGRVFCWGSNSYNRLGNGQTGSQYLLPTEVAGLTEQVTAMALGQRHACVLGNSGAISCWGANSFGQSASFQQNNLPLSTATPVLLPEQTAGLSAGWDSTCALAMSGQLRCWGWNGSGQLGAGEAANTSLPASAAVNINSLANLVAGGANTCALNVAGQLFCAGANNYGQAGTGSASFHSPLTPVAGGLQFEDVSPGGTRTCGLTVGGAIYCWGREAGMVPTQVNGLVGTASMVASGAFHACAVADETAYCWGNNTSGELGLGGSAPPASANAAPVLGIPGSVAEVSAGASHSCAVTSTGAAYCWGSNSRGLLGDGTTTSRNVATPVLGMGTDVASISAGTVHTCAVKVDGTAWCWGYNLMGGFGNGSTTGSLTPVQVNPVDSDYIRISSGNYFTCAMTLAGDAFCFGYNTSGQIGIGTITSQKTPSKVATAVGPVVNVTVGGEHACAFGSQGSSECWGGGQFGQLANNARDWSQPGFVVVPAPDSIFQGDFD